MADIQKSSQVGKLVSQRHVEYILGIEKSQENELSYYANDHLRASAVYWMVMSFYLLGRLEEIDKERIVSFMMSCLHESGGFGCCEDSDPHIIYTHSAVLVLSILGLLEEKVPLQRVAEYIKSLQNEDGSFKGDEHGEVDIRFIYCAMAVLKIIGKLDDLDIVKTKDYILRCRNFDGGFGNLPGAESHAGHSALSIMDALDSINLDFLGSWLCERQLESGGLNGRPQKLADICYSWWALSSLEMIDRINWISAERLEKYIFSCQDSQNGGFAPSPENNVDLFHTMFALAGLSLLKYPGIPGIDPRFCIPKGLVP